MYCLHCKYTTKLRNDKEINAFFASAQQSKILPQKPQKPQKLLAQEEPPTDFTDVHRLGGYGIPAIPTQPLNYLPTEDTEDTEASGGEEKSVGICEICGRIFSA